MLWYVFGLLLEMFQARGMDGNSRGLSLCIIWYVFGLFLENVQARGRDGNNRGRNILGAQQARGRDGQSRHSRGGDNTIRFNKY